MKLAQLTDLLALLPRLLNPASGSSSGWIGDRRIIIDAHRRLNPEPVLPPWVDTTIGKEERSRDIIFDAATPAGRFFEIGSGDGEMSYLLGISSNFTRDSALYTENKKRFEAKFSYVGLDLDADPARSILGGDICSEDFFNQIDEANGTAAVVYSNNVFEHLKRPWIAARNVYNLLQPGGVCITVVPFAQRYHESPGDYFRYTHTGIASLFEDAGPIEIISSGYDILGRRTDWQGSGQANDAVPIDEFGAWRETWFTFFAFRKTPSEKS